MKSRGACVSNKVRARRFSMFWTVYKAAFKNHAHVQLIKKGKSTEIIQVQRLESERA